MRPTLSVLATLSLATCVSPGDQAHDPITVLELEAPAGVGSGQPYLSSAEDGVYLTWQEKVEDGHQVRIAHLGLDGTFSPASTVAQGDDFFVNWADFPSVTVGGSGRIWTHWLQREEGPGLAYAIRVASSSDGGTTWSDPWTPHEEGTPTEHGFVSLFPLGEGIGLTWLDGRGYAPGPDGTPPTQEMTVRARTAGGGAGPGPEALIDPRSCDCCQTDVAVTTDGPVMVYRDRSPDEVRDIYVSRLTPDGWEEGRPVHEDGWVIGGCPVNGPAIDARENRVVVAWFTGAGDTARVKVAHSSDGAVSFGPATRIDRGNPAGRVDVRMLEGGDALVTWLERTTGDGAELRLARVTSAGEIAGSWVVSASSSARASGFPRTSLIPGAPESLLVAWTDVSDPDRSRVRVARVELP